MMLRSGKTLTKFIESVEKMLPRPKLWHMLDDVESTWELV